MTMIPTLGRTVLYTLTMNDAEAINRRRTTGYAVGAQIAKDTWPEGAQAHIGNPVVAGQEVVAVIVAVWGDVSTAQDPASIVVNLKCLLDGSDDYWVTSVGQQRRVPGQTYAMHYGPGTWRAPTEDKLAPPPVTLTEGDAQADLTGVPRPDNGTTVSGEDGNGAGSSTPSTGQ